MDILRNLFGNVTSGIIRLAVTAGILFCAYLFIVKPVLDTTNEAIKASGINEIGKSLQGLGPQIERQVTRSFRVVKKQGGNPQRLLKCVKRAHQDVAKIERCTRRF
ncbi:MAG TPA: hypothetical protein VIS95_03045 [Solirubrobacterales bacterium]